MGLLIVSVAFVVVLSVVFAIYDNDKFFLRRNERIAIRLACNKVLLCKKNLGDQLGKSQDAIARAVENIKGAISLLGSNSSVTASELDIINKELSQKHLSDQKRQQLSARAALLMERLKQELEMQKNMPENIHKALLQIDENEERVREKEEALNNAITQLADVIDKRRYYQPSQSEKELSKFANRFKGVDGNIELFHSQPDLSSTFLSSSNTKPRLTR